MLSEYPQVDLILAEDNDGHAELIIENLRSAGFAGNLRRAGNGHDALKLARQANAEQCPFLVLLDLNMPGLDGFDVLESLREDCALRTAPVIVFTSSDRPTEIERCYELGCNLYLTKPVAMKDFTRSIRLIADLVACARFPMGTNARRESSGLYRA